ncbi:winged helix-turn-helix transcriptional regulator [Halobaculum magnesiiphilum]|nr:helix-turn-helix domain-containing protein [Halobaculum magnesiiphilum]
MTDPAPDADDRGEPDRERCYCRLNPLFDLLSRRHAMGVVCIVGAAQPVRYSEIEATFGEVSSSTLSARLDELTEAGLLDREQRETIPPRVEYALTDDGERLRERLEPVRRWTADRSERSDGW